MTKNDIPHLAKYMMEKHGLIRQGWKFAWDHSKRRAGCCKYRCKTISLSKHYVERNVAERLDDVIDTILHEIAHALTPGDGHGAKWKIKCIEIGARPERCYDAKTVVMPDGRYRAVCSSCARQFNRHKRPRRGLRFSCRSCGPQAGGLTFVDMAAQPDSAIPQQITTPDTPPKPRKLRRE